MIVAAADANGDSVVDFDEWFDFFDSNNDGAISLEDDFFLDMFRVRDRNGDGKATLSEALGVNLISLPAPIYNFYNKLDRDTDERLTKAEALDFISKLFTLINTDSDCKIDVNEVLELLNGLEVPWDHQLAVKMVLDQVRESSFQDLVFLIICRSF